MFDLLTAPFVEFAFMRRALAGCLALSLSAAPMGVFLVLRRMSLAGDAIGHALLPGAALGYVLAGLSLPAMTLGGFAAGLIVALGAGFVARATALREDASLAAFYLVSLALGVTIVSLRGSNVDLLHVLFGNVLALDKSALILLGGVASLVMIGLAALYRPLVLETLDPYFLASVDDRSSFFQFGFLVLVVLSLVGGFQALGTLLAVGLMMLPAAAARLWSAHLGGMLALSALFAFLSSYIGLILSFYWGAPSGPAIILCAGALYFFSLVFGRAGGYLAHARIPR